MVGGNSQSKVSLSAVAMMDGEWYCKACFTRMFKQSGGKYSALSDHSVVEKEQQARIAAQAIPEEPEVSEAPHSRRKSIEDLASVFSSSRLGSRTTRR